MQNPYEVMTQLKKKVDSAVVLNKYDLKFSIDEIEMIQKVLEYGTHEWWEDLKDIEEDN